MTPPGWCGWCREHSDQAAPLDHSAVTHCMFIGMTGPVMWTGESQLHIHGAVILDSLDHLTVRAAVRRLWKQKTWPVRRRVRQMRRLVGVISR